MSVLIPVSRSHRLWACRRSVPDLLEYLSHYNGKIILGVLERIEF